MNDSIDDTLLLSEFLTSAVFKMRQLCQNLKQTAQTGNALAAQMQRRIGGSSKSTDYILPAMKHFGEILCGITSSQEILAECLQNAFISPLDTFNKLEVSKILGQEQQYKREHASNNDSILRYLQSDASNTFGIIRSLNQGEIDSRAMEVVQQRKKFELFRFDFVRDMNTVKAKKNFEIVEALISAAHALRTHHKECYENLQSSNAQFNAMSEQPHQARITFLATKQPISMLRDGLSSELDRMIEQIEIQLPQTLNSSHHSQGGLNQIDTNQNSESNNYSVGIPSDLNVSSVATHAISRFTSLSASFMGGFSAPKVSSPVPEDITDNQRRKSHVTTIPPKVPNNHTAPSSSSLGNVEMRMKALDIHQLEPFYSPHSGQEYCGLIKQGYLLERSAGKILQQTWSREWFVLDDSKLYKIKEREMETGSSLDVQVVCETMLASIRELKSHEVPFTFEISYANKGSYTLQAEGHREYTAWVAAIRHAIEKRLMSDTFTNSQRQGEASQVATAAKIRQKNTIIVKKIFEENKFCAECDKLDPDWLSLNLGCLICIDCSGVHRSLGVHISKVRSLTLDDLEPEEYLFIQRIGNNVSNSIWEASVPVEYKKPQLSDSYAKRERFIRAKYQSKLFLAPLIIPSSYSEKEKGDPQPDDSLISASNLKNDIPWKINNDYHDSHLRKACKDDDVIEALKAIANGADIYAAVYTTFTPIPHEVNAGPLSKPISGKDSTSNSPITAVSSLRPSVSKETTQLTSQRLTSDLTESSINDSKLINCRRSPLHIASKNGAIGCVVMLLMNGADPHTSYVPDMADIVDNDSDHDGGTPLEVAERAGHDGLVSYLRRKLDLLRSGKVSTSTTGGLMTTSTTNSPLKTLIIQKEMILPPLLDKASLSVDSRITQAPDSVINELKFPTEIDFRNDLEISEEMLSQAPVSIDTKIVNNEVSHTALSSKELTNIEMQSLVTDESDPTIETDCVKTLEISNAMISDALISNSIMIDASGSIDTTVVNEEVGSIKSDDDDLEDFYTALMKDP
eukprot:CAMPEP_0119036974 /NCGR_PEP_ID=MMETSP1177-20130426/5034_1 /TAXON_ID=2985 /ORGANISM="Ochromonas sp, Strain CCMP1899" /LENGTH=1026 /DNA_ID=CAMNT_0006997571 /DNA_START=226 /DNA_END=3306 /DNA_ORIENTATION=+